MYRKLTSPSLGATVQKTLIKINQKRNYGLFSSLTCYMSGTIFKKKSNVAFLDTVL